MRSWLSFVFLEDTFTEEDMLYEALQHNKVGHSQWQALMNLSISL